MDPRKTFLIVFILNPSLLLHAIPSLPAQALPSRSGYLPVTAAGDSAIFYTFYEAQNPPASPLTDTPLLIWLQGGPGCSSMVGNFFELGPWRLNPNNPNLQLEHNPGAWNRIFGLLFLDNPIGTGFSIASSIEAIPRDQDGVARHLYAAITKFIGLDPSFRSRQLYITGESYAGKYIPAIGSHILKMNSLLPVAEQVNLAGVAIGNGFTDPATQVATHAANAYFFGLINESQKCRLEQAQSEAVKLAKMGNWSAATDARNKAMDMLQNMTGFATLYDFTRSVPYETHLVTRFLKSKEIKRRLKAKEDIEFIECSRIVGHALHDDMMKSTKHLVEFMLRHVKVLLYQGHLDLRIGVVSNEAWIKSMAWEGIDDFLAAERKIWKVEDQLAGYVQKWDKLCDVVLLGAGHLVPADQPLRSQAMIEDWVIQGGLFRDEIPSLAAL
uniref:Carboxypeptidase n=1 Tax=Kalanchoe fedtschenkoi TaxID=63787 RepID=A0A7N1A1Z1_KALFE